MKNGGSFGVAIGTGAGNAKTGSSSLGGFAVCIGNYGTAGSDTQYQSEQEQPQLL